MTSPSRRRPARRTVALASRSGWPSVAALAAGRGTRRRDERRGRAPGGTPPRARAPRSTPRASPAPPRSASTVCPATTARTTSTRPSGGTTPATSRPPTGARFGFQLTFFRRGLSPGPPPDGPGLATNQVYFAHLAVTDVAAGRAPSSPSGGAGARASWPAPGASPSAVWLEDWRVESRTADGSAVRLVAARRPAAARPGARDAQAAREARRPGPVPEERRARQRLALRRVHPPRGPGAADRRAGAHAVSGEAWFDHEWSTSALGAGAVGWDWFSLQLDDGRELMYFQIRRDGRRHRAGLRRDAGGPRTGGTRRLARGGRLAGGARPLDEPGDRGDLPCALAASASRARASTWSSSRGSAEQEMRTSFVYWEGAVRVSGTRAGDPCAGHGYVELTGYARSMQGVF